MRAISEAILRRAGCCCLFLSVCTSTTCTAQVSGSAPDAAAPTAPTLKERAAGQPSEPSQITLVLQVEDRKGRPVSDLKPSDIKITDGGTAIESASLQAVDGSSGGERLLTLLFGNLDAAGLKRARVTALSILKALPRRSDSYAVLGVDGRLRLFTGYTSGRAELQTAIGAVTNADPGAREAVSAEQEKQLRRRRTASRQRNALLLSLPRLRDRGN